MDGGEVKHFFGFVNGQQTTVHSCFRGQSSVDKNVISSNVSSGSQQSAVRLQSYFPISSNGGYLPGLTRIRRAFPVPRSVGSSRSSDSLLHYGRHRNGGKAPGFS